MSIFGIVGDRKDPEFVTFKTPIIQGSKLGGRQGNVIYNKRALQLGKGPCNLKMNKQV